MLVILLYQPNNKQIMLITRTSPFSGKVNSMNIEVTPEEIEAYNNGELIQRAFPRLSADEREFIKTGITPTEWEETFGDMD
jgi:hypothetical protein